MTTLWDPIQVGNLSLPHRFAMAPMTRSRANPDGTPGPFAAEYYAQRASLGLLITEGVQPSEDGQGYLTTPGMHTDAQVEVWRKVTSAVHDAGARMFIQFMHVGRMSHPDNTPHHRQPVAPSALAAGAQMYTMKGMLPMATPRALSTAEVKATVQDMRRAAALAMEAGADGVELHGANGYLLHQFFAPNANTRTDEYGGSYQNRARVALEAAHAVAGEIGPERTAIRISPLDVVGGIEEGEDNFELYRYLARELDKMKLAYLHVYYTYKNDDLLKQIREAWTQPLMLLRATRTLDTLGDDVESGLADMVSIGKWALANPDFVERYKQNAPLNKPVAATFYGGTDVGYIDYPKMAAR
ncbi:alkene reductase [Paraburkholderia solisilvae]|uniref:N-ethylmaleimide reductase n=1 Tax=Paraburkholderia solisilvae TaxID=624376 RepID=A0A6J5E7I1_9BURK|nr:alkene reductase [Paraburkholderia solisilvae]CAB3761857.1 N-ethylmaleimide reductase [Paraburkholderia solisilvae]